MDDAILKAAGPQVCLPFACCLFFLSSGNTWKQGEGYDYSSAVDWHCSTLPPTDSRHDIKIIISPERMYVERTCALILC